MSKHKIEKGVSRAEISKLPMVEEGLIYGHSFRADEGNFCQQCGFGIGTHASAILMKNLTQEQFEAVYGKRAF